MQLGRCNELCVECCERHLAEHTLLAAAHSLQANTTVLGVSPAHLSVSLTRCTPPEHPQCLCSGVHFCRSMALGHGTSLRTEPATRRVTAGRYYSYNIWLSYQPNQEYAHLIDPCVVSTVPARLRSASAAGVVVRVANAMAPMAPRCCSARSAAHRTMQRLANCSVKPTGNLSASNSLDLSACIPKIGAASAVSTP